MKNLKKIPNYEFMNKELCPSSNINSFIKWANNVPLLTHEEEVHLANDFHKTGNIESARILVVSHIRLVIKITRDYIKYGLHHEDLIQEGSIGLMKAVKHFDPSKGIRLAAFAIKWIKSEIYEFILKNRRILKIATTKAQRKLFFNLKKLTSKNKNKFLSSEEAESIAKNLNVDVKDVSEMEERLNGCDESIESFGSDDDDNNDKSHIDLIGDDRFNPDVEYEKYDQNKSIELNIQLALSELDDRSIDILNQRLFKLNKKVTLNDLAKKYGISAERVRQIEKQAIKKVKKTISKNYRNKVMELI